MSVSNVVMMKSEETIGTSDHVAELDKLAWEYFSEFGFVTCSENEQQTIIEIYLLKCQEVYYNT